MDLNRNGIQWTEISPLFFGWGSRSTLASDWAADQQVEQECVWDVILLNVIHSFIAFNHSFIQYMDSYDSYFDIT